MAKTVRKRVPVKNSRDAKTAKASSAGIDKLRRIIVEKEREIKTLTEISKSIVSGQYTEDILQMVVTLTAQMMGSKICSIMVLDEKKDELKIIATQSLSSEYKNKPPLKVGQSISGRVVEKKKPIAVFDVTKEPGYMYPDIAKKEGLCSMLAVPMMLKDRVIGVINSYTTRPHKYRESEMKVLQAVANQAAVAIENRKLMEDAINARQALEDRKLIERAKGILMKERSMTEEQAYGAIRRKSMDTCKPMKDVAEAIIIAFDTKSTL
ncbi:MAG: GAF and ANTAR domain-containing protein [Spirochaetia bacterium]|nr:GAF and ANTAR domain-containing protein [Spirochaetia bacterium]